jgi:hypothetical protein
MLTTDPKQALLTRAASLVGKTSGASVLWKYVDDEGGEFYLPEKKIGPMKSPFSGKSFTGKPERSSMNDVGRVEGGGGDQSALFTSMKMARSSTLPRSKPGRSRALTRARASSRRQRSRRSPRSARS